MKRNLFIGFWRFNGIVLLNILLFFCLSCQKEEPQTNLSPVSDDGITFRDGRLIFKDKASFTDHQKWLYENQSNTQLIAEKNKSLGLKSMTEYYLEGMKLEENDPKFADYVAKYPGVFHKETYDNSTLYLLPHSELLCYVANKDGIFQIGDQIFRIADNYIYQTGDESKIEMLFLPKDKISTKDVTVTLSQPRLESKSDLVQKTIRFKNNNRFRIVSSVREYSVWVENPAPGFTTWYYDIITNPQKRTLGIWARAQLNTKSANDDGYIRPDCPGCTEVSLSGGYKENTGLSQRVIHFVPDYRLDLDDSYSPAYSRGRLIDGTTEYLYICWDDALDNYISYEDTTSSVPIDPYY